MAGAYNVEHVMHKVSGMCSVPLYHHMELVVNFLLAYVTGCFIGARTVRISPVFKVTQHSQSKYQNHGAKLSHTHALPPGTFRGTNRIAFSLNENDNAC